MLLKYFVTIAVLSCLVEGARILVYVPVPSISHQVVFRPLTQELAKRGHKVVVITTDPAFPKEEAPANLTEIDIHDLSYKTWRDVVFSDKTTGKPSDALEQITLIMSAILKIFEMQMGTEEVKNVINNGSNHYDLLILEALVTPTLGLTHLFKVPVIAMSSLGGFIDHYNIFGAPSRPPLLYPTPLRQRLVNLSIWERISELYNHYKFENIFKSFNERSNAVIKTIFGPDVPDISELNNNLDLLFLNVHPIWEFSRPVPPNIIYMGGLHQKVSKELPKDLKSYLDSSKNGIIYISYGTNVSPSMLPPEKIQILVKAFSELPYDVLWKWDKDELPNRSSNIKISKWLPQSDLLKHPKIKLFITQGGLQSTDEAIAAGVPLIGMPMLGDQWYNVEMYLHLKIGVRLDMENVTKENFKDAINTVIDDGSYRKNIERLRSIINDQPQKPLERAIWWTEHLLRHGSASHLRPRTANISWSEYLDVELLTVIGVLALISLTLVLFVISLIYKFVRQTELFSSQKFKRS